MVTRLVMPGDPVVVPQATFRASTWLAVVSAVITEPELLSSATYEPAGPAVGVVIASRDVFQVPETPVVTQ